MSGFQVEIAALRRTGAAAEEAAKAVRAVHTIDHLPGGDAGMPGATAVAKLAALHQLWEGREAGFARELADHSRKIAEVAAMYSQHEQLAQQQLHEIGRHLPPAESRNVAPGDGATR